MSTLKTNTIENVAGDKSVAVAGLSKIEDTGKNICTAWVSFDGKTTPPTIKDSFNVSSIANNGAGDFTMHFTEAMDTTGYALVCVGQTIGSGGASVVFGAAYAYTTTSVSFNIMNHVASLVSRDGISVQIFGGKN